MFKRKRKKRFIKNQHIEPSKSILLIGCWTDEIHRCQYCGAIGCGVDIRPYIKCCICGMTNITRIDDIFQWKDGRWNNLS